MKVIKLQINITHFRKVGKNQSVHALDKNRQYHINVDHSQLGYFSSLTFLFAYFLYHFPHFNPRITSISKKNMKVYHKEPSLLLELIYHFPIIKNLSKTSNKFSFFIEVQFNSNITIFFNWVIHYKSEKAFSSQF